MVALFLLGEMNMVVDMLLTEAVIALAARAVAELQVGVILVGLAADRALVAVELSFLFLFDAGAFLAEIDGCLAGALAAAEKFSAAKQQEVCNCHHGQ